MAIILFIGNGLSLEMLDLLFLSSVFYLMPLSWIPMQQQMCLPYIQLLKAEVSKVNPCRDCSIMLM